MLCGLLRSTYNILTILHVQSPERSEEARRQTPAGMCGAVLCLLFVWAGNGFAIMVSGMCVVAVVSSVS